LRVLQGANRATRCALIRGARGDPERAREASTTPPSAARLARCAHVGASLQTSTADPGELHRSGTLSRSGTTRWRTDPIASQFHAMRCLPVSPIFASWPWLLYTGGSLEALDITVH
jgi:hypothetical protein